MLVIRLPAKIEERLDVLARKTGRTKTSYAREAILKHLGRLEAIYMAGKRAEDRAREKLSLSKE
jgi:RHH-type rel operon transcriptional repressor/antitoxin RelB